MSSYVYVFLNSGRCAHVQVIAIFHKTPVAQLLLGSMFSLEFRADSSSCVVQIVNCLFVPNVRFMDFLMLGHHE